MHRSTLLGGLVLILLMCIFPPVKTGAIDALGDLTKGQEVTTIEYRPIWAISEAGEDSPLSLFETRSVATSRLLLQVVIVVFATGVIAYLVGPSRADS